jgi:hypothetical protein
MRGMRRASVASIVFAAAAYLALVTCGEASAQAIDTVFKFHGLQVAEKGGSLNIGTPILDGPIITDNTDLVLFGTTLDFTPIPIGVGEKFTLGWETLAGAFTDTMTETSVLGDLTGLLRIQAAGTISGGAFSPSASVVTLNFEEGGLSASFKTLTSLSPVPEMSSWSMLLAGFAALGAAGIMRARRVL